MEDEARIDASIAQLTVPIDTLVPWPGNPRRGRLDVISDSLSHHGQYKPIIVRKGTNEVLAGNHTWRAAKDLGWRTIAVVFVDVDDDAARRIVLMDNHASDAGFYDDSVLLDFLDGLPDLSGTGFDDDDLDALRDRLFGEDEAETGSTGGGGTVRKAAKVTVGDYTFAVEPDEYDRWDDEMKAVHDDKPSILASLRERFSFPAPPLVARPSRTKRTEAPQTAAVGIEDLLIPIDSVEPFPGNPRQGDVNLIAESLARHGQYRPIVVNQRTLRIIAHNHTWRAAKQLGWTHIAATFMDCDAEEERRRLLVDNRASDLAKNDDADLMEQFQLLDFDLSGTGFLDVDVQAIEDRLDGKTVGKPTVCVFGKYRLTTTPEAYAAWLAATVARVGSDLPHPVCEAIAQTAGFDPSKIGVV